MGSPLDKKSLDVLFNEARTFAAWQDKKIDESLLKQIYDLTKMAPTSANCQPLRVTYIVSKEAKEKLKPTLDAGNVDKTMSAPATAILAMDMEFYHYLPVFFPHAKGMKEHFAGDPEAAKTTAFRNGSIQGGYFILAARALGLDCGPMSGFNNATLDEAFFKGTAIKSNFLCNLGYGDATKLYPRGPRPGFDEFCKVL